tara:strand:+ start:474 stop:1241 length:768 start_codon:yes stop_codon:yes gene_type:complete
MPKSPKQKRTKAEILESIHQDYDLKNGIMFNFELCTEHQDEYYSTYPIPEEIECNVAVDLGCNMGFFVRDHHERFNKLYAIDACYQNFIETLKRALALQLKFNTGQNITCFNLACAGTTGDIIKIYRHSPNMQSVSPVTVPEMLEELYEDFDEWRELEFYHPVMTISFDGLYDLLGVDYIDYLKVDIEGAEFDFLLGQDLSRIGALALEAHGTLGQERRDELENYVKKYFDVHTVMYDDPAPSHSVKVYLNKSFK